MLLGLHWQSTSSIASKLPLISREWPTIRSSPEPGSPHTSSAYWLRKDSLYLPISFLLVLTDIRGRQKISRRVFVILQLCPKTRIHRRRDSGRTLWSATTQSGDGKVGCCSRPALIIYSQLRGQIMPPANSMLCTKSKISRHWNSTQGLVR